MFHCMTEGLESFGKMVSYMQNPAADTYIKFSVLKSRHED